jgi:hypothetical protein
MEEEIHGQGIRKILTKYSEVADLSHNLSQTTQFLTDLAKKVGHR